MSWKYVVEQDPQTQKYNIVQYLILEVVENPSFECTFANATVNEDLFDKLVKIKHD